MTDDYQQTIRDRRYRIGWYRLGAPKQKTYAEPIFDSWHAANKFAEDLKKTFGDWNVIVFVDAMDGGTK